MFLKKFDLHVPNGEIIQVIRVPSSKSLTKPGRNRMRNVGLHTIESGISRDFLYLWWVVLWETNPMVLWVKREKMESFWWSNMGFCGD
jgi:hypothetical protein